MKPTTLLLARHGATEYNLIEPYVLQGRKIDPPLAPVGLAQASALAAALAEKPLAAIYASEFRRAQETAAAVAGRHALPVKTLAGIGEIDIGLWEGLTWDQIAAQWPSEKAAFDRDEAAAGYFGGENFFQLRDRVVPALESLAAAHPGETVLAVGHNGVNRVALAHWLGIPLALARKLPQENCGYSIVELGRKVKVRTINVAAHLSGAPVA
ncbi:MAG TPA: histidine phosphatase family protein [Planctomycetia bacterium]|nr:histidine phosphatase family protein [Planctomycetia bacterium]